VNGELERVSNGSGRDIRTYYIRICLQTRCLDRDCNLASPEHKSTPLPLHQTAQFVLSYGVHVAFSIKNGIQHSKTMQIPFPCPTVRYRTVTIVRKQILNLISLMTTDPFVSFMQSLFVPLYRGRQVNAETVTFRSFGYSRRISTNVSG
jgi:hypothetical protein